MKSDANAAAYALKPSQTGLQPRSANNNPLNARMAPKPILLNAEPIPATRPHALTWRAADAQFSAELSATND